MTISQSDFNHSLHAAWIATDIHSHNIRTNTFLLVCHMFYVISTKSKGLCLRHFSSPMTDCHTAGHSSMHNKARYCMIVWHWPRAGLCMAVYSFIHQVNWFSLYIFGLSDASIFIENCWTKVWHILNSDMRVHILRADSYQLLQEVNYNEYV